MKLSFFISTRVLLLTCNFMLMLCGISLIISGFLILCDWPKVLLSRLILPIVGSQNLPQPPLYYAALVLLGTGLIICSAAVLGCWSACIFNYFILTIAFLLVLVLLLSECIVYGMLWLWPGCIGLTVSPTYLARTLQRNYGKSGFEQYTAAVDYAQTNLNCCGITSSLDYDSSIWKLHGVAKMENGVPTTCCIITNIHDPMAYMRPSPLNQTKCQISEAQKNIGFRHQEGCANKLKRWYEQQYGSFFIAGIFVIFIEFFVLLIILLACTRVNRSRLNDHNSNSNDSRSSQRNIAENIYENEKPGNRFNLPRTGNNHNSSSNGLDAYTLSKSFRQNYHMKSNSSVDKQ